MPVDPRSNRKIYLVQVIAGTVYRLEQEAAAWETPTNNAANTPALDATNDTIYAAVNGQKMFFADGKTGTEMDPGYVYYDPITDTVEDWVATVGDLPVDDDARTARLICTWRGRTVLSGLIGDPQNWFMSRVSDPFDWDYAPEVDGSPVVTPDQAIAGNNAPQGFIGDVITGLCPFTDDRLIMGCEHSIYVMNGDPMIGGSIGLVTDKVGMAFGKAFCMDPYGNIYFLSDKAKVYMMQPGQLPVQVSRPIDQLLAAALPTERIVSMNWDHTYQGIHLYVTPTDIGDAEDSRHFMLEQRNNGWFTETFAKPYMNPRATAMFDNEPIVGCWDGYVRGYSSEALGDDGLDDNVERYPGFAFDSEVWLGPLTTKDLDEIMLFDMQAVMSETSREVTYEIYVGDTAEEALSSDPVDSDTLFAGRNPTMPVRASGHAIYIRLFSSNRWQMEQIRARWGTMGLVRGRSA